MSDTRTLTLVEIEPGRYRDDNRLWEIVDETVDGAVHGTWRTYRHLRYDVRLVDVHDDLEGARRALAMRLAVSAFDGSSDWTVECIDDLEAEDREQEAWDDPLDRDVEPLEPGYTIAIPGRLRHALETHSIYDADRFVGTSDPDRHAAAVDLADAWISPKVRKVGRGTSYEIVATAPALRLLASYLEDVSSLWDDEDGARDRAAARTVIDRIDETLAEVTT